MTHSFPSDKSDNSHSVSFCIVCVSGCNCVVSFKKIDFAQNELTK